MLLPPFFGHPGVPALRHIFVAMKENRRKTKPWLYQAGGAGIVALAMKHKAGTISGSNEKITSKNILALKGHLL